MHIKIVIQKIVKSQLSRDFRRFNKLVKLVREQRLTDCLQLLEKAGYTGDLAIFILQNCQQLGEQFGEVRS